MSENCYSWWSSSWMSRNQIRILKKKMEKSFQKVDKIIDKSNRLKQKDELEAENLLNDTLNNLDK